MRSPSSSQILRQLLPIVRHSGPGRWITMLLVLVLAGWSIYSQDGAAPLEGDDRGTAATSTAEAEDRSEASAATAPAKPKSGQLTQEPGDVLRSPAGLEYAPGSRHGHRLKHVMAHCRDEPGRPGLHGVFLTDDQAGLVTLLDEAYRKAEQGGAGVRRRQEQQRTVYTVDMQRQVGYVGGRVGNQRDRPPASHIRLVLEDNRVITAFPLVP